MFGFLRSLVILKYLVSTIYLGNHLCRFLCTHSCWICSHFSFSIWHLLNCSNDRFSIGPVAKPITLIGGCYPALNPMKNANGLFWNRIFSLADCLYAVQLLWVDVYTCPYCVISYLEPNLLSVFQLDLPFLSNWDTVIVIGRLLVLALIKV